MNAHDQETTRRQSPLPFVLAILLSFVVAIGLVVAVTSDDAGHVDQMKVELPLPDAG